MRIPAPNYTQTPNDLFDHWLPILGFAELKVLLVIIQKTSPENENQYFIGTNSIKKLTNLEKSAVLSAVFSLLKRKMIEEYRIDSLGILEILMFKKPQNISGADQVCAWCQSTTFILHEHHFPLKISEGGKETVNICANCHCEFHFLEDSKKYRVAPDLLEILKGGV